MDLLLPTASWLTVLYLLFWVALLKTIVSLYQKNVGFHCVKKDIVVKSKWIFLSKRAILQARNRGK
jgi:hypothetical protein